MISIRRKLYVYLTTSLCIIWLLLIVSAIFVFQNFIIKQFDAELENDAIKSQGFLREIVDILPHTRFSEGPDSKTHEFTFPSVIKAYRKGYLVAQSTNAPDFPKRFIPGYTSTIIDGEKWRVLYRHDKQYDSWFIIAKPYSAIDDEIYSLLPKIIWPIIVALPLILFCIFISVKSGLATLNKVAKEIHNRTPDTINPITVESVPKEISPLILSLNDLLSRLDSALTSERRFTDNAAHELRTPLAALKTEVQVAILNAENKETIHALKRIHIRVDAATRLISQLLDLTRINANTVESKFTRVTLDNISMNAISDVADHALDKDIDIEINENHHFTILGQEGLLVVLVKNLLDNAIKYTPNGGKVKISIESGSEGPSLIISDTGPGIPENIKTRIFDPFYREAGNPVSGSGLGMSIVKRIADLHKAKVTLENLPEGGLKVKVLFTLLNKANS